MTIGSLFAGIGGLELGLEWAGVGRTVWQVEQDPYCTAVLAKHWPDAARFTDVREVGAHNLPPVDVICGGFPCQDISFAGKGAGLAGERSGLWHEFARVARELRPRYIVVENVAALLTRGLDVVLGTMASLGYDAEWSCIQARDVGAPHERDRVFLIGHMADAEGERGVGGRERAERARRAGAHGGSDATVGDAHERNVEGMRASGEQEPRMVHRSFQLKRPGIGGGQPWATEPDVGRVAHGIPARVDRLRALGNAVVPQVAEVVGRRLLEIRAERARGVA